MTSFGETIGKAYAFEGTALELGKGIHEDAVVAEAGVRVPLRMLNRHGLIAGATGTGKTVTLQVIAEQLAAAGRAGGGVRREGRPVGRGRRPAPAAGRPRSA